MRAILTIFPHPAERQVENQSASAVEPSRPRRSEAILPTLNANSNQAAAIESIILQRLLAEIEARAATRFPAPYLAEQAPQTRRTGWFRAQIALLWVLSIVLCIIVVKYLDREKSASKFDPAQTRSITTLTATINDQNKQFSRMFDSIQQLTTAVASSSLRTTAMQAILNRLGGGLNQPEPHQTREKIDFGGLKAGSSSGLSSLVNTGSNSGLGNGLNSPLNSALNLAGPQSPSEKIEFGPTLPPIVKSTPPQPLREQTPMEILPSKHHHQPIGDVVAMDNVVVHHNKSGVMDYWLVPRIVSGAKIMTKVVPIAQTTIGVFVHNAEDGNDYIVTPSSDWLAASDPNDHQ